MLCCCRRRYRMSKTTNVESDDHKSAVEIITVSVLSSGLDYIGKGEGDMSYQTDPIPRSK